MGKYIFGYNKPAIGDYILVIFGIVACAIATVLAYPYIVGSVI